MDSRKNFQFGILTTIALIQLNYPHYIDALSLLFFKYVVDIPLGRSMKIVTYWFSLVYGFCLRSTLIAEQPAG